MTTLRIPVSRAVIQWAVIHGEKSESELRQKFRLDRWENPQSDRDQPIFTEVQDFSRETGVPFDYFFRAEAPDEKTTLINFRTASQSAIPSGCMCGCCEDADCW